MRKIEVVAAIIFNDENKVLIAKRKNGSWEFPGGKVEKAETHQQALERELFEEFGVSTKVSDYVGVSIAEQNKKIIELFAYKTQILSGEIICYVHEQIKWVFPQEINNFFLSEADKKFIELL